MGSLSEAFTAAKRKRVEKVRKILLGKFTKGDRVKVVCMPQDHSVHWLDEWVGFEGVYIGPALEKGISNVYFPYPPPKGNVWPPKGNVWLVDDMQLRHL